MPLYRIDVTKRFEGFEWHNNYVLLTASLDTATTAGHALVTFERKFHFEQVEFIELKVSPIPNPDRNQHRTVLLTLTGQRIVTRGSYGEAKRVLYVMLEAGMGMPGRKMYRYCVSDEDYQGKGEGALITSSTFETLFENAVSLLFQEFDSTSTALLVNKDAREVTTMVMRTVSSNQTRKRHYNRAPATGPIDPPPVNP